MLKLKIPPPVYMLLTAGLIWLLNKFLPVYQVIPSPWNQAGYFLMLLGLTFDATSLVQFFRVKTTVNPIHPDHTHSLVTHGIYQFTRNPMYLGLLLLLTGFAILQGSLSTLFVLPLFLILITNQQIIPEEMILENKFGQQYLDYKNTVRRWL